MKMVSNPSLISVMVSIALLMSFLSIKDAHAFPLGQGVLGSAIFGDTDGDLVQDSQDTFPNNPDESVDIDSDLIGDNADNCKLILNPNQLNSDGDQAGDACDTDDDNDGVLDVDDLYPMVSLAGLSDTDGDGQPNDCDSDCIRTGMAADADDDNDGFSDEEERIDGTDALNEFSCRIGCFSFDIDGNEDTQALVDGLLVIRHLFGFSGDALTAGATASDATRAVSEDISSYLTLAGMELDIDGDGKSTALTDGLLLIRYLFGFSGDALISGAISDGANRDTAEAVEAYLKVRMPAQVD
jgi:hypothetical protein